MTTAVKKQKARPTHRLVREVEICAGIWIEVPDAPWGERERASWYWPDTMLPSEWAEKYRIVEKTALPGPWRNEVAPYLVGIMNMCVMRGVERLVIKKAAQLGASEGLRNVIGYWAHLSPAPMGLALPNKEKGREIVENELVPFFNENFRKHPELKGLMSMRMHDIKKGQIKLANPFIMHLMWSGSPASMASNPMKRAIDDEVNKFADWAGNDADPVSLIEMRMRTYPDRLHILNSTPTGAEGAISTNFEACGYQFYFLIPCPHCGTRQRLLFGEGGDYGVKWSDEVRALRKEGRHEAAASLAMRDVWYQCCSCHGKITEVQKRAACRAGKWGTVGKDQILADGVIEDALALPEYPRGSWVGMQISSLYCCWESWTMAHVAAEFLRARTLSQRFAFRTSTLGEHWEEAAETVDVLSIDERVKNATLVEGVLPAWTARLITVVDTQKDHFWMVIRAWGAGMRSHRVWHGKVFSFEEIEDYCFKRNWTNEDPRLPEWKVDKVLIDSGGTRKAEEEEGSDKPLPSRVMDVYAWGLKHRAHVNVIKGDARPEAGKYIRKGRGEYVTDKEKKPVEIWLLDVHHFHDQLADLMGRTDVDVDPGTGEEIRQGPTWGLNQRHDPEYHHHLANMHKISERSGGRGGEMVYRWRPVRAGMRVDYRACEAYQVAGAYQTGVHLLPDMPTWMQAHEAELQRNQQHAPEPQAAGVIQRPDGRPFVTRREG